jgi:hypothetical protein
MKSLFRALSVVFGIVTLVGIVNGLYHLWNEWGVEVRHELSVSMLAAAAVTAACAVGLFWVSRRM